MYNFCFRFRIYALRLTALESMTLAFGECGSHRKKNMIMCYLPG